VPATIGLVLGAGGVVGAAWISGVLAGIQEATGWDARSADLVVGTSAGASIAANLRHGFSPGDHMAQMLGLPMSAEGQRLAGPVPTGVVNLPDPPSVSLTGWRPQAPRLSLTSLTRIADLRLGITLSGLVPVGTVPHRLVGDPIRARQQQRWPDEATWICAVRLDEGRLCVLGRDEDPDTDLATAVEASVAIPGYFEPVEIDGRLYVDGGAHSVTNVDLVAGLGFDLVVAVTPLTAVPSALRPTPWQPPARQMARVFHARQLAREVRAVRASGTPVLVIQPTMDDLRVLGPALRASSAPPAAARGRITAIERFARDDAAEAGSLLGRVDTDALADGLRSYDPGA
jgi:NTE family protein